MIVFKYRVLIVSTFVTTVLVTLVALWMRDPSYETEARILIKYGREASTNPRSSLSQNSPRISQSSQPDINSEAELLKSYSIAEKVVDELQLHVKKPKPVPAGFVPRLKYEMKQVSSWVRNQGDELQYWLALKERITPKERAIVEILENLTVEAVKQSSVVDVKLRTNFKEGPGLIVNRLIHYYREARLGIERNPAVETFFDSQAAEYSQRLQASEAALSGLKSRAEISSLPDQLALTARSIAEAEMALRDTGSRLDEAQAQVNLLETQVKSENPRVTLEEVAGRNAILDTLNERKSDLVIERQRIATKVTDSDPRLADLDQQIASVNKMIADADKQVERSRTLGENSVYVELRKQAGAALRTRDATQARYRAQQATVASLRERLKQLQKLESSYAQLSRDIEMNGENYKLQQRNAVETRSAEALNAAGITSISLMDPAVDPILPVGMRRVYIFGGALAAGLLLGFGLAFLGEALSRSVNRPEHVTQSFGAPLLARFVRQKSRLAFPPTGACLQETLALAARIEAAFAQCKGKTVAVMGANPGAGASTVARMLAHALSANGATPTVLVDFEQGGAALNRSANEQLSPGLARVSAAVPNMGALAGVDLLNGAPEHSRVVIDVPSFVPRQQQIAVASLADCVVMVVEAERSRREVLHWLRSELDRVNAPVVGAALNKQRYHIPEFVYRWL